MKRILLAACFALCLAGCQIAPKVDINNEDAVTDSIIYDKDEYSGLQTWRTPFVMNNIWQQRGPDNFDRDLNLALNAYRSKGKSTQYQLYVNIRYNGAWRHYDTAFDSTGYKFRIQKGKEEIEDCSVMTRHCVLSENIAIIMTRSYLEEHSEKGLDIAVYGGGIKHTIILPGSYVKGFLNAVPDGIESTYRKKPSIEGTFKKKGKRRK